MSEVVVHPNGEVQVNGRWMNIDADVTITGERGKFKYKGYSTTSEGKTVLNFHGGPPGRERMRFFYPDRVKTVHNKKKRVKQ